MTDDAPTQRIIYLRAVVDAAALLQSPTSPADALAPTDVDAASGQLIVTSPVQTSARAAGPVAFAADIGDTVRIYTRALNHIGAAIPEIVEIARALPSRDLVLDGEAIAFDTRGRPLPFQISMRRFGRKLDVE